MGIAESSNLDLQLHYAGFALNTMLDSLLSQPDYAGKFGEESFYKSALLFIRQEWAKLGLEPLVTEVSAIERVGEDKPLAYASGYDFVMSWTTLQQVKLASGKRGLKTIEVLPWEGNYVGGALFVYDALPLQKLLKSHQEVLNAAGWPSEPESFVQQVIREVVPSKTPLYDLIADAFGDTNNPERFATRSVT